MRKLGLLATSAIIYVGMVGSGNAALVYGGNFPDNDCKGGFPTCHADTNGAYQEPDTAGRTGSPSIFKVNSSSNAPGATENSGNFASIDGSEFDVDYDAATNTLSFTYTPGANDPEIHYFTIKQANGYALFYDLTAEILSASIDLDLYFPRNPGWSHITWFDTASTGGCRVDCDPPEVPEPATLALLGSGLLGLGLWRRRRSI